MKRFHIETYQEALRILVGFVRPTQFSNRCELRIDNPAYERKAYERKGVPDNDQYRNPGRSSLESHCIGGI
jgi:hypothetical protein